MTKLVRSHFSDNQFRKIGPAISMEDYRDESQDENFTFIDSEIFIKKAFEENPAVGCELLFRKYYKILCNHAVRYVYSRDVAEDIVSEVFCRFWKLKSYESVSSSYRFYLFRSVRNQARNHLRAEFKNMEGLEMAENKEAFSGQGPDEVTQFDELSARVQELVEALPPQCRKIFLMNRFEGIKYKDIALQLRISLKTVEAHMCKAIKMMRLGLSDVLQITLLLTLVDYV